MRVIVSLLRGVNVGGRAVIRMEALREVYESLGLTGARTFIQSGNVVFRTGARSLPALSRKIEGAIEAAFDVRPAVILRTAEEMRGVVGANPFAGREFDPAKLLVTFLVSAPDAGAGERLKGVKRGAEEIQLAGRELFIYFPDGMGRSKLSTAALEKAVGVPGTGRNWNSVVKLAALAEEMEGERGGTEDA